MNMKIARPVDEHENSNSWLMDMKMARPGVEHENSTPCESKSHALWMNLKIACPVDGYEISTASLDVSQYKNKFSSVSS